MRLVDALPEENNVPSEYMKGKVGLFSSEVGPSR